ncbi:MAG: hypothetical protein MJA31_11490 [Clostridia bacterium]|nr:hypothetical protein [Clostridia bacterium]
MPKAFEGYIDVAKENQIIFKVPRDIDRKDANPGMDLYDYVVAAYDHHICILKRAGNEIIKKEANYQDIQGISNYQNLLLGELTLFLDDETLKIKYNTVSSDIIFKFVKIIRNKYITTDSLLPHNPLKDHTVRNLEIFYFNELNRLKQYDNNLKVISLQPTTKLSYKDSGFFKKVFHKLVRSTLPSSLYLSNQKEMIIITKGRKIRIFNRPDYSYTYTYIPYNQIQSAVLQPEESITEVEKFIISTKQYTFDYLFISNNDYKHSLSKNLRQALIPPCVTANLSKQ